SKFEWSQRSGSYASVLFAQIDVKRTGSAVTAMSAPHIRNEPCKVGFFEPARHHRSQHPTRAPVEFKVEGFIRSRWFQAFARHDQRQPRPTRTSAAQKCNECAMRCISWQTMKVQF